MSLFSQGRTKDSLPVYGYIIAGGIGSLLILFLIQKSLPSNNREARQYQRNIEVALEEMYELEKALLVTKLSRSQSDSNLNSRLNLQIDAVNNAISNLKQIPSFINQQKQSILENQLNSQQSILSSQSQLVAELLESQNSLNRSCLQLPKLKQELVNNSNVFAPNIIANSEVYSLVSSLIDRSLLYCQNREEQLRINIQNDIREVDRVLNEQDLVKSKFIISEFINDSKNIIEQNALVASNSEKIDFSGLSKQLKNIDAEYFILYQKQIQKKNNYRIASSILVLLVVIFIAYKIISNLTRTNRNIVKILEGFTKELETKVEERTAQLEESIKNNEIALAQAQNANQAKSRFLANMSHELRTPLNAILGFTQLMSRDTSIGEEQQENLKIINRSGEHLLKLINDILEMSKIEVGQITLNESQFDLHIMLKSIEEMLRLKAEAKNLNLSFNIAGNVPRLICADEGKLRQIVINLLGNALKFTERGSIILTARVEEHTKAAEDNIEFLFSDTYSLYFSVEDTGPGIAPEEMSQLFTPFEQTNIGRNSNEGTGLGLSICHKFVELMGGELQAKSTIGKGSIFFFNILLRSTATSTTVSSSSTEAEERRVIGLAPSQKKYRILAVDDVAASRLLLNKLLTGIGFQVKEAGDGQQAIALWQEWHPELILMDMRMPIIDGYEATRQIKAQAEGKSTIIIALTASAFEEERVEILSAGCDDFMRKPFKEDELLTKIGQYLNIDYLYEEKIEPIPEPLRLTHELTRDSLAVMPEQWRSQLYEAASQVDNQEIFQLLSEIPDDYQSLAKGLADLAEQFRCDRIIDLAKSGD